MIGGLALSFGAPLVLFGLLALPVIWWLLKLTPPRPQTETFPPLRILQRVLKAEETPSKSPWWLTLLRLVLAALVILALSAPVLNPREGLLTSDGPLAIVLDNGWASGADWEARQAAAEELIQEAGESGMPVSLALTAGDGNGDATPVEADAALERLAAAEPQPIPPNRPAAAERLLTAFDGGTAGSLALLTDGLDSDGASEAFGSLSALGAEEAIVYRPAVDALVGLTNADNSTEALTVDAVRPEGSAGALTRTVRAVDAQGREIGTASLVFEAGESTATARFEIPVELRNDIARLEIVGASTAGAVRLVDDSFRRRRVGLISGEPSDLAQPLLSPLYYISRALSPFADLVRAESADLSEAIPNLLEQNPSVIVMADIGVLPEAAAEALRTFVEEGGTLVRFAGPRLAGSTNEDVLVPVELRAGGRQLGGALTWSEPQQVAAIPPDSPLAGIEIPDDVTVSRQVLAEPSVDLVERTWASLEDGTPLVTANTLGAGTIVLFHITAEATWSNLPISGAFVEMLRRIVSMSRAGGGPVSEEAGEQSLPPYRVLDGVGRLTGPGPDTRPLVLAAGEVPQVSHRNPPGLYGTEDGYVALNLLAPETTLSPLPEIDPGAPVTGRGYAVGDAVDLRPWLFAAALVLFALDALALLWINGAFSRIRQRFEGGRAGALPVFLAIALLAGGMTDRALAQEGAPTAVDGLTGSESDALTEAELERAMKATETTHLAYVITGDEATDNISERGLAGLTQFIAAKTSLEPGEPMGVDIETDELSFFPILYWPIEASAPMPSANAISRIDAYMKQGGTVLFDVQDDTLSGLSGGAVSDAQRRLQEIVANLDIPPLEPVPPDHVLTKAFYILDEFLGRHSDSELWVEALVRDPDAVEQRPARSGDGVSSIMITSNDFASAWAIDNNGMFLFPTDTADPSQREYAYRAGVNIVMYTLTGNYKADQVHVPALLERLGQ